MMYQAPGRGDRIMDGAPLRVTEEQIAAAQLRLVLDEKLGRQTPKVVRQIAATTEVEREERKGPSDSLSDRPVMQDVTPRQAPREP